MPQITIEISEQDEARIMDLIRDRQNFQIDGGRVHDGEKIVFLDSITFKFHKFQLPGTERLERHLSGETDAE